MATPYKKKLPKKKFPPKSKPSKEEVELTDLSQRAPKGHVKISAQVHVSEPAKMELTKEEAANVPSAYAPPKETMFSIVEPRLKKLPGAFHDAPAPHLEDTIVRAQRILNHLSQQLRNKQLFDPRWEMGEKELQMTLSIIKGISDIKKFKDNSTEINIQDMSKNQFENLCKEVNRRKYSILQALHQRKKLKKKRAIDDVNYLNAKLGLPLTPYPEDEVPAPPGAAPAPSDVNLSDPLSDPAAAPLQVRFEEAQQASTHEAFSLQTSLQAEGEIIAHANEELVEQLEAELEQAADPSPEPLKSRISDSVLAQLPFLRGKV